MCKHAACASKSFNTIFFSLTLLPRIKLYLSFNPWYFPFWGKKELARHAYSARVYGPISFLKGPNFFPYPPSRINCNNIYVWFEDLYGLDCRPLMKSWPHLRVLQVRIVTTTWSETQMHLLIHFLYNQTGIANF